jgi:PAS domain S-box-containing protein
MLAFDEPSLAELEACVRYTLGLPGAVLSGAGFLHYARVCQVALNYRSARRGLRMAGFAFFAYAAAAGAVVGPSDIPASQVVNTSKFLKTFGIPIELLRTLIGGFLLFGMARLIQTFNTVAFNRLLEARGEAHSLRQRSELILDLVDDGVCGIDEAGNISFANSAARRLLGYEGDILGLPSYTLRNCRRSDRRDGDGDDPYSPPFPHPEHYRSDREFFRRRDGTCFPVEYTSAPKYEGTRLTGAVIAFRDISERRRHEVAERCEQEERFEALFDQAAVGMAVVALDGRCLQVNARLSEMLGFSQATMAESSFADFLHPDEREQCGILKARLIDGEKHTSLPVEGRCIRHDNSTVWVQFSFAMVRDCNDRPMYCFLAVEDISERKQAERMREHYQTKLEQQVEERTHALARSNKELESANRELEAFSYSVSHDLRSPLRAINGFTHALAEDYGHVLGEAGLKYIELAQNASVRMSDLIDSLLNLSRVFRSELALTSVNLSQLVGELADQLQQSYPNRRVAVHIEPGLVVEGDATLLHLLLQNLLDNAWKFTSGCESPAVTFGSTVCGGRETYFVSDNGVGFEGEYAHKLFQPFERLHGEAEYEGIGIGLATVRRIVQRHNGIAWAIGQVGKGATFYFTLDSKTVTSHARRKTVTIGAS